MALGGQKTGQTSFFKMLNKDSVCTDVGDFTCKTKNGLLISLQMQMWWEYVLVSEKT